MDYNYTRIFIDIDTSLRHLNDSLQKLTLQPQQNQSKADFIREIAPKIALTIAPSGKVDFPSVIQLASSWYNDIEEYISDMDVQGGEEPITTTTEGYMLGGYYYEFQTPDELKTSEEEGLEAGAGFPDVYGSNEY